MTDMEALKMSLLVWQAMYLEIHTREGKLLEESHTCQQAFPERHRHIRLGDSHLHLAFLPSVLNR